MTATLERNRVAEHAPRFDLAPQRDGINISPETVTESTARLEDEHKLLIRWLYAYAREMHWGWDVLQGQVRINRNTLYKVWTGKYTDDEGRPVGLNGVCETIAVFRKLVLEREGVAPAQFAETSVYRRIEKVCSEARIMQMIAFIYGESQIGKTFALKEVARRNNHGQTIYFRLPASGGEFFKELAKACFISGKNSHSKIRDKLFRTLDHTKLLLADELHLAFEIYNSRQIMRVMETLRELHDQTGCGLVLCGTEVFKRELKTGDHAKMLTQLLRRGIIELQLPKIAPEADVLAIAQAWKLKPPTGEAADLVKLIIAQDGLGKFTRYLTKAAQMAARQKSELKWDHFAKVHFLIEKLSNWEN